MDKDIQIELDDILQELSQEIARLQVENATQKAYIKSLTNKLNKGDE